MCRVSLTGKDIRALAVEQIIDRSVKEYLLYNGKCPCGQLILLGNCKFTEKLLSGQGVKFKCINSKLGCKSVLASNALEDHESNCNFRLVPCLENAFFRYKQCDAKLTLQEVLSHYEENHNNGRKLEEGELNHTINFEANLFTENYFFNPIQFKWNNHTFLWLSKFEDKIVHMWVYMIGTPNEARQFSYRLSFMNNGKASLTFEGKVATLDESFDALSDDGKCFAIPRKTFLAQFVDDTYNQDGLINFDISIFQIKGSK